MTETPVAADPIMTAIDEAVTRRQDGDLAGARAAMLDLWDRIGVTGDPLHRCSLAHSMADFYDDPAQALAWDVRALDAADATTDERVQAFHAGLEVAGFYPSLHLNLADDYRRLGSFAAAQAHVDAAEQASSALPDGPYGDLVRGAIKEVAAAIGEKDTAPRPSAPGTAG
jgi:hypothetical protein